MQLVLQLIFRFIILVLVQIFVLDNIQFLGYINPMIYVLFILSLPVKFPYWLSLLLAFVLGATIDVFSNTLGMHIFATVFLAFIRVPVTNIIIRTEEGVNFVPTFKSFGVANYIKYIVICVLMHHIGLFFIESFSLQGILFTLIKVLVSSAVTIAIILLVQTFKSR
ncbi:MAG: rod shape-determining protein MreD [Paludibacteraceae bacterium]